MKIPSHVAIIMDGNGRWAQKRGLSRTTGHQQGVKNLKEIVKAASEINIPCLTLYAFSTENWRRPKNEIHFLFKLFAETLKKECCELAQNNVKIKIIGRRKDLPPFLNREIKTIEKKTEKNDDLQLNIAFNYGGRAEIVDIVRKLIKSRKTDEITEELISKNIYITEYPEVELLIRTGGEKRLSNFMLWECAYSELYFTDKYWPDFNKNDFITAVKKFAARDRRFGGIK